MSGTREEGAPACRRKGWCSSSAALVRYNRDGILGRQFKKKTRVFCTMLSTGAFLKKTRLYSGFKNTYKKSTKKNKKLSLFMNSIMWEGKIRVENQTKT
jgi:hypothetical protein